MMKRFRLFALVLASLALSACMGGDDGSGEDGAQGSNGSQPTASPDREESGSPTQPDETSNPARPLPEADAAMAAASCEEDRNLGGARSYRVEMPSRVDGAAIVFQVFEPRLFDCQEKHPLILQGHGFSGSRATEAGNDPLAPIKPLVEAGYTVISIDQRGHGESGGDVRVMDPEYAGQDLVQIVDWAEAELDYLAYEDNNLLLGGVGGSYGGGFQYLLYNVDPDRRMDAMVPQITWHDLTYSLNPGNVPKSYWAAFLSVMGDAGTGASMDPFIRSTLLEGLVTGKIPGPSLDFFHYHSPSYFADNERDLALQDSGNTSDYALDPVFNTLPLTSDGRYVVKSPTREPYPVDVLMFQGIRDNLFPLNEAWQNYRIFEQAGGDVRLLTYPFGHQYIKPDFSLLRDLLEEGEYYAETVPSFPDQGLNTLASCGDIQINQATLAWFNEKLRGRGDADQVITTGEDHCLTLSEGDAISVSEMPVGGESVTFDDQPLLLGPNPLPTPVELGTMTEDGVIAGIPTATIEVGRGSDSLDEACLEETDPLTGQGTCDAIFYVGIGVLNKGELTPIDGQVHPVRGFGTHEINLTGIAERLAEGDQLALMLYPQHSTFPLMVSRDLTSFAVTVSGTVDLPLLSPNGSEPLSSLQR